MKSIVASLLVLLSLGATAVHAQSDFPSRPITIVVPFPPGGGPDKLARVIGEKLSAKYRQPVVVDNRAGASGTIAAAYVAKSAPDGYTLMMTPNTFVLSPLVLPKGTVSYDVQSSFAPVILPSRAMLVLAANPTLGIKTFPELIEYAKKNPGMSFTGSASGSPMHVAGEMLKQMAGVDMMFVPYKGLMPAVTDTVAGHVNLVFGPYGTIAPFVKSGRLVALGGLSPESIASAPEVVPLNKQGYPKLTVDIWSGLFAPQNTPAAIVSQLNRDINAILLMPDVKEKLESTGETIVGGGPEVLAKAVKLDLDTYEPVVRKGHITAE